MSIHEEPRPTIDRDAAERLLSGDPATGDGHRRIASLLAAAQAPAHARELAGEDAAVAAFEAALASPARSPRRNSMLKTTLAKLLTVKAAAACVAVFGAGGVALAASTGNLPGPLHKPAHHSSASPSTSAKPHPSFSGTPSAFPSRRPIPADLLKLCDQWSAHNADDRKKALDDKTFSKLIERAGHKDRDRVDHFCADLHKPRPSGSYTPSGKPSAPPSARPDASASGYPGSRRTDLPSGSPDPTRTGR